MSNEPTENPFSPTSGARVSGPLIPEKTLAWAGCEVRAIKNSKTTEGEYADMELTVADGPFKGRKIWDKLANPFDTRNSEGWRGMAVGGLTRFFESAGIFDPVNPESYNVFIGRPFTDIVDAMQGQVVAIKIKIEDGEKSGQADRNVVSEWLSPNPKSGGHKDFCKLVDPAYQPPVEQVAEANRVGFLTTKVSTTGVATPVPHDPTVLTTADAQIEAQQATTPPVAPAPVAAAPGFTRPAAGGAVAGKVPATPGWLKAKTA